MQNDSYPTRCNLCPIIILHVFHEHPAIYSTWHPHIYNIFTKNILQCTCTLTFQQWGLVYICMYVQWIVWACMQAYLQGTDGWWYGQMSPFLQFGQKRHLSATTAGETTSNNSHIIIWNKVCMHVNYACTHIKITIQGISITTLSII